MASMHSAAVYALEVPPGDIIVEAAADLPGVPFRITMAAIDPSESPTIPEGSNGTPPMRATLKLLRQEVDDDEESDYLQALLNGDVSDDEDDDGDSDEDSDEDIYGGPSDPAKSKSARKAAIIAKLKADLEDEDEDDEDESELPNGTLLNGINGRKKGKGKAVDDESESDSDGEDVEFDKYVLCTLDPEKAYQQPLDITITSKEQVFFQVSGTHTIYLTGNYVDVDGSGGIDYDDDDDEYDLSPDADELDDSEESDELDDLDDPRIMEIDSEEEIVPKLISSKSEASAKKIDEPRQKGKNKRAAEESVDETSLDDLIAQSVKPEEPAEAEPKKLSKKQLKKQKNNAGKAVPPTEEKKTVPPQSEGSASSTTKSDKKVQFAKNLEQGPTGSNNDSTPSKAESKLKGSERSKSEGEAKPMLGVKMVQGVKIDDKKVGKGRMVKKGDKVSMRYIGKLASGAVFDSNKKGTPFTCKIGTGEVIKGWDIGVLGMTVLGERRITVPPNLAYGSSAKPGIPANSQLIFEIKVLDIQ